MEIDTLLGLPAHPLVIHGAVVLVPVAVLAFAGTAWRRELWLRYSLPTVALAVVAWAFAFLAVQSGEPLEHHVRDLAQAAGEPRPQFGDHPELGEMTGWLSLLFALGVAVFFSLQRWLPGRLERKPLAVGLYVMTCAIGFLALFWMLRAGHSGADLVWGD